MPLDEPLCQQALIRTRLALFRDVFLSLGPLWSYGACFFCPALSLVQSMARRRPLPAQVQRYAARPLALCVSRHTLVLSTAIFWVDPCVARVLRAPHVLENLSARYAQSSAAPPSGAYSRFFFLFLNCCLPHDTPSFFSLPGHHETMRSHVVEGRRCAVAGLLQRDLELRLELPGVGSRCKGYAQDTLSQDMCVLIVRKYEAMQTPSTTPSSC